MSLIDEALKRAQEASQKEDGKTARPWTPAPLPDAGLARRIAILRAVGWTLGGLSALAVLAFLGRVIWNSAEADAPARAPVAVQALQTAPTPEPTLPETVVAPPRSSAGAAAPAADATPAPVSPRPTRAAPPSPAAGRPETVAPESPKPSGGTGLTDGRTYIAAVPLPEGGKIELGGIVWSEEEPRALLNDRIVAVGGYVEGFNVVKIDENRVVLSRDGMTIYLAVR